jgi:hypothetical protein
MMIRSAPLLPFALLLICASGARPALAQDAEECSAYFSSVRTNVANAVPIVPDTLLVDWKLATKCLIKDLTGLKGTAETISPPVGIRNQFLGTTGALRAIVSKLNKDDEKANVTTNLDAFIGEFRNADNTDVISVLAFGARSNSYQARSNSLLLLANVIDNTTVCVPLDHLWDPDIGQLEKDNDYSVRGRANLLSVVSVVAPWAYSENFHNIQRAKNNIWDKIDRSDPNLKQTVDILNNIQLRLNSQGPKTNQSVSLPDNLKADCIKYGRRWATENQLKY